jgi:ankyrin repeat protein
MQRPSIGSNRLLVVVALVLSAAGFPRAAEPGDVADAAMRGDLAAVRALIQQQADVNGPQVDGTRAIHWAVYHQDVGMAEVLIGAGADLTLANRAGATPFAMAALYGPPAMIERLLRAGAAANERGPSGETPIMLAARNGNPDAIKLLLASGADVDMRENLRNTTALMWAAEQRHAEAVKVLLDGGADFSAQSGPAGLPRNYVAQRVNSANVQAAADRHQRAIAANRTYEEQLEWEIANGMIRGGRFGGAGPAQGAAPRTPGPAVGTPEPATPATPAAGGAPPAPAPAAGPLPAAGGRPAARAGQPGQRGAARPSVGAPVAQEPTADDDDSEVVVAGLVGSGGGGLTALVFAAREGDLESAKHLIDAGADINQSTEYGWSPLLVATNNRHYRLAAELLARGADANLANKGGWTPLYLATDNRNIEGGDYPVPKPDMDHLEYIKLLLEHGADPDMAARENTLSRTIFTMQWFFEAGATPFVRAAQSSDTALMSLLLEFGADPTIATDYGDTALTAAAGVGWVEGVTYERSPEDNVAAIRMLLDLGLDPNAANRDGRTPLMGAALKGRSEVVRMLVDAGARLDQRDLGSRDTDKVGSLLAGHTWQALDYADGLVRVGVQSAVNRPETAALIRRLMTERGMTVPPPDRVVESICVVELCQERQPGAGSGR